MRYSLIALLVCVVPPKADATVTHVDVVEVNHVFCSSGELVLDQIIWLDWNAAESRFDVRDWRLLRGVRAELTESQINDRRRGVKPPPVPRWVGGHACPRRQVNRWVSEWYDEKDHKYRRVWAEMFHETWTPYDPELRARQVLPQDNRRKLP